jgi:hypothetical protein
MFSGLEIGNWPNIISLLKMPLVTINFFLIGQILMCNMKSFIISTFMLILRIIKLRWIMVKYCVGLELTVVYLFLLQLACCCGSAACSLCCSACPSCRNSTSSRIMYAVMLLLGTIAACITLSPGLQDALKKVCYADNSQSSLLDPLFLSLNSE